MNSMLNKTNIHRVFKHKIKKCYIQKQDNLYN